jgi:hypothetical protein
MRRECKTTCSLTLPLYIEVTVPSQEIEQSCTLYIYNNKNYHTVRTVPKSNKKITEKGKIDTTNYNQSVH